MREPDDFPSDPAYLAALEEALHLQDEGRFDPVAFARDHPEHGKRVLRQLEVMDALVEPGRSSGTTPIVSEGKSLVGRRLGDFELVEEIGRGGMGVVYGARQRSLDREVAVKILPPAFGADRDLRLRFEREAAAAAGLSHPAIVKVHAFGEDEATLYLVMERVHGASLAEVLSRLRKRGAPGGPQFEDLRAALGHDSDATPPSSTDGMRTGFSGYLEAVVRIGATVADALEAAHDAGLIHRDVKPGNILLDRDCRPHLTDFGLVRGGDGHEITLSGQLLGTPGYLAPETVKRSKPDARADLFSLGVVLYEALSLEAPFTGRSTDQVLHRVLLTEPPPLHRLDRRISKDLSSVVFKAMEKEPGRRYATAGEFRDELRRVESGDPVLASRVGPLGRMARRARRRPLLTVLGAGLVAAVLLAAFGLIHVLDRSSADRRQARERLAEGKVLLARKNLEAARVAFRQANQLDADLVEAGTLLAELTDRLGRAAKRREYLALLSQAFSRLTLGAPLPAAWHGRVRNWIDSGGPARQGALLRALAARADRDRKSIRSLPAAFESDESVTGLWLRSGALAADREREAALRMRKAGCDREPATLEDQLCAIELALRPFDPLRAQDLLRRAKERWPDLAYLPFKQAHLEARKGNPVRALELTNAAIALDDDFVEARILRADLFTRTGKAERAIEEFDAALERDPANARAIAARAHALFWNRQRDRAFDAIEQALERLPGNPHLLRARGRLKQFSRRFEDALADYRLAEKAQPGTCLADVITVLYLTKRNADANAMVDRYLASETRNATLSARLLVLRADHLPRGPGREQDLRRSVELVRNPHTVFLLGENCFARRRYAEAFQLFSEAHATGRNRPLSLIYRGACRWMLLAPKRARADLDRGLKGLPNLRFAKNLAWPYLYRAHTAASLGNLAGALRFAEELLRRKARPAYRGQLLAWLLQQSDVAAVRVFAGNQPLSRSEQTTVRAWLLAHEGRYATARRLLARLDAIPALPSPLPWLAIQWAGDEDLPDARRAVGRALFEGKAAPQDVVAVLADLKDPEERLRWSWVAGHLLLEAGKPRQAIDHLEAADVGLAWPVVDRDLGIALILAGNTEEALALWKAKPRGNQELLRLVEALIRHGITDENRALVRWLGVDVSVER